MKLKRLFTLAAVAALVVTGYFARDYISAAAANGYLTRAPAGEQAARAEAPLPPKRPEYTGTTTTADIPKGCLLVTVVRPGISLLNDRSGLTFRGAGGHAAAIAACNPPNATSAFRVTDGPNGARVMVRAIGPREGAVVSLPAEMTYGAVSTGHCITTKDGSVDEATYAAEWGPQLPEYIELRQLESYEYSRKAGLEACARIRADRAAAD